MANTMGMPYGLQAMLKEGHKHFSGVEEAVMKSVEACKAISKCTRTSLGPTGESDYFEDTVNRINIERKGVGRPEDEDAGRERPPTPQGGRVRARTSRE